MLCNFDFISDEDDIEDLFKPRKKHVYRNHLKGLDIWYHEEFLIRF